MHWFIRLLLLSSVSSATVKDGLEVLSLWHTSTGQDAAFFQGRGFLIHFIDGLAEGTNVIVKTINADANIDIQFQKESANFTWRDKIMLHMPCNTGNHVISSNDISEAVFKYFDQNKKQKRAEEVFLIVTNKSVVDNEGKVKEALSKKKTFVVVCGKQTGRNVWTDLATDNNHLKELQDSNNSFYSIKESLLKLSLKDSNLLCDTDEYYTGERCYRCSYICSSSPSEYCLKDCRYFNHPVQETDSSIHQSCVNDQNEVKTIKTFVIVITVLFIIFLIIEILLLVFCWLKFFKKLYMEKIQTNKKEKSNEKVQDEDQELTKDKREERNLLSQIRVSDDEEAS